MNSKKSNAIFVTLVLTCLSYWTLRQLFYQVSRPNLTARPVSWKTKTELSSVSVSTHISKKKQEGFHESAFIKALKSFDLNCATPDFLVVGTQKGGTSSLHSWLKLGLHADLHVPLEGKELDLLTSKLSVLQDAFEDGRTYLDAAPFLPSGVHGIKDSLVWYQKQFYGRSSSVLGQCPRKRSNQLYGEASPNYSVYPYAPERAHALMPNAKIFFLLRNPIDRVKSAFNMKWQIWKCSDGAWKTASCFSSLNETTEALAENWVKEFEIYVDAELQKIQECIDRSQDWTSTSLFDCYRMDSMSAMERYWLLENNYHIGRSLYVDHFENWLKFYRPDKIKVLSSEELDEDPISALSSIFDFLGVDKKTINIQPLSYKHHVRQYAVDLGSERVQRRLRLVTDKLADLFKPFNERLFDLLDRIGQEQVSQHLRESF